MRLETQIQRYIQENNWNLNYHGNTAKNIFGTEYTVTLACTDTYFDLSSVRYGAKEITLKDACGFHKDAFGAQEGTEYLAQTLAHEISHTETYGLTSVLAIGIVALGIKKAIEQKHPSYILKGAIAATGAKFFTDEFLANLTAYAVHGASTQQHTNWTQSLLDLL
ncbi:hypothetical protein EXS74_02835 [Candidatus Woesearchaeota archaeon]|nr:hypothetical protein [Candidatus Woesearchaeota archaeon]